MVPDLRITNSEIQDFFLGKLADANHPANQLDKSKKQTVFLW
jgi:hypothetical protein